MPPHRPAFTLLEILLTTILSGILLASLWSLFGMYSKLFETGQIKASRSQLIRGLMQQLSDDLHNAIQDTAEVPLGATGSPRRFGLFGSAHALQLDVMQTAFPRDQSATPTVVADPSEPPLASEALELRTVRYTFQAPSQSDEFDVYHTTRAGLTRYELDFQTSPANAAQPAVASSQPQDSRDAPAPPADVASDEVPAELAGLEQLDVSNDDSVTWIPEVVSLEFRYFDGVVWSSTWNSLQRKSLPVAVEILLQIHDPDELPPPVTVTADTSDTASGVAADDSQLAQTTLGVSYRLLVDLPAASLHQTPTGFFMSFDEDTAGQMPDDTADQPAPPADATADVQMPGTDNAGALPPEVAAAAAPDVPPPDQPGRRNRRRGRGALLDDTPAGPPPDQWMRVFPR